LERLMQVRDNGGKVITNSDDYNPAEQFAEMVDSLSVITPVPNSGARDLLLKWVGRTIRRLDLSGSLEYWDGTQWIPDLISTIWSNTGSFITPAGGGPGALTLETAISQNPSFVTSPAANQIKVALSGVYSLTWNAGGLASASGYMAIKNATATGTYAINNFPASGEQSVSIPNLYLAAEAVVTFVMGPSKDITIGSTIRVTKVA